MADKKDNQPTKQEMNKFLEYVQKMHTEFFISVPGILKSISDYLILINETGIPEYYGGMLEAFEDKLKNDPNMLLINLPTNREKGPNLLLNWNFCYRLISKCLDEMEYEWLDEDSKRGFAHYVCDDVIASAYFDNAGKKQEKGDNLSVLPDEDKENGIECIKEAKIKELEESIIEYELPVMLVLCDIASCGLTKRNFEKEKKIVPDNLTKVLQGIEDTLQLQSSLSDGITFNELVDLLESLTKKFPDFEKWVKSSPEYEEGKEEFVKNYCKDIAFNLLVDTIIEDWKEEAAII